MFKVGDFVRCVDNNRGAGHHLEVGKVYKVSRVRDEAPNHIRLEGVLHDWRQKRFIPWEPQVGDEVVLKKWEGQRLDQGPGFPNVMDKFVGEITTISSIHVWSVRVVGNDWNWDKEWGIEPNYHGRPAAGGAAEAAIIDPAEWIPKAGDRVIIESNPAADWIRAVGFDVMIGEEHILQNECVNKPGWWKLKDVAFGAYIHISGLRLVAEGAARPLEEPVRGFNERVKGMVAEAKKKAQKPVKPKKLNLKAVISKARKELQEVKKSNTCCFSLVGVKGSIVHQFNHACHWDLRYGVGGEEVAALFDNLSRYENKIADQYKAAFKKYVIYLMKRSPIAHAFKTKTYTEAMTRGVSYNVSSCTADEIAVACCSLRFAHEHTGRIDVWDWCLKHKYSENVAYFMMNCYFQHKNTFCLEVSNWHNIIDGEKSFAGLINGIVKGFHDDEKKPRYSKRHEYGVSRLTHKGGKGESLRTVIAAFSKPVANPQWGAPPAKDVDEAKMHEICKFIDGKMKEALAPKQAIIA